MAEVNLVKVVTTDALDDIIKTEDAAAESNNSIHESREDLEDNDSDLADFEDSDLTDWEDDEDDDNDDDDEKPKEPWICERRHSGDGEEQPERANENKLDDDEDKKNPAYIPRKGTFFEHDLRHGCEEEGAVESEKSGTGETGSRPNKMLWCWDKAKWEHDKFDERSQRPKSCKEIVAAYGFDIRTDKNKITDGRTATARPRGRRVDQKSRLGEFIQQRRVISSSLYFGRSGRKLASVKTTRGSSVGELEKPNNENKIHEKSAMSADVDEVREAGRNFESAYRKSRGERKEDKMRDGKTDEKNNQENIYVWRRCGDRGRANEGGRSGARSGNVVSRITRGSRFRAGSGRIGGMSRFSEENHRHPDKLARVTTSNANSGRRSISGVRKNVGRSVKKNLVVANSKLKTDVPDVSYREKESNNKIDKGKENEMQKLEKSFSQIRTSAVSKSQDVRLIVLYDTSEPDICREGRRVEISNRSENKKKRNRVIIQTTMTPDILPPMTCIQTNAKSSDLVVSQKQQPATSTVSSETDGSVISSDSSHQAITSTTHSSKLNPLAQYFCHSKRYSSQRQKTGTHEYRHPSESKQQPASLVMQASAAQSMFATEHMKFYSQQLISGSNLVPSSIVPISFAPPASLFAPRLSSPFIRPSRVIGFGCPPMAFSYQMPLTSSSSPPKTMPYQMPIPPSSTSSTTSLPLQYASGQFASNPCLPAPSIDHSVCPIEVRGGTVYFSPENQQPPKKSLGKMVYFDVKQQSATVSRPTLEKRPKAAIVIIDPKSMKDLKLDVGGIGSDKNVATTDNADATTADIHVLDSACDAVSTTVDLNDPTTTTADMDDVTAVADNVNDTDAVATDDDKSLVTTNSDDIATIAVDDSGITSAHADDIATITVVDSGMTSAPADDIATVTVDDSGMTSAPCDDIVDAVADSDVRLRCTN